MTMNPKSRHKIPHGFVLVCITLVGIVSSQRTSLHESNTVIDCRQFQSLIDETYDFKPTKLSEQQQTEKSNEMDKIWETVKADQKNLIPCLIAALERPDANSFFLFDGSTLLFNLDRSLETKTLLIRSFARANLDEIELSNWIAPILKLGFEGLDTSAAGEAWLSTKKPFYFLPQHGTLPVEKGVGAIAIYGSMDEQYATPALAKLASSNDPQVREIAVGILLDQATPEAFRQLRTIDRKRLSGTTAQKIAKILSKPNLLTARKGTPKTSRDRFIEAFEQLVKGDSEKFIDLTLEVPDGEKDAVAVLKKDDIPLVRKARRYMASTGTPHVQEWYDSFTKIIMALVWKSGLGAQETK